MLTNARVCVCVRACAGACVGVRRVYMFINVI